MEGKRFPTSPPESSESMSTAKKLEELIKERTVMEQIKSKCPLSWSVIDTEITRLQLETQQFSGIASGMSNGATANDVNDSSHNSTSSRRSASSNMGSKKRVKLPIPADKYPEYNFVGRLLGPRGATLKALERETGCKIMIRGRGSIRKDKETEVRGKPGWEHVFNEPLHVVIEADFEEPHASRALNRAKEAIELLLVPVPEENDSLKRQQLRDLAILNGTFRGGISEGKEAGTPLGLQTRRTTSSMRSSGVPSGKDFNSQGSEFAGAVSPEEKDHDANVMNGGPAIDSLPQEMSRPLKDPASIALSEWEGQELAEGGAVNFASAENPERFTSLGSGASFYGGAFSSHNSMVGESLLSSQSSEHTRVQ